MADFVNRDVSKKGLRLVYEYDHKYQNVDIMTVFEKAGRGDAEALYELATRYNNGERGVEKDTRKAVGYYKEVLKYRNHIGAFYYIGYFLTMGELGEERKAEGLAYFGTAYRLGDEDSAVQLGLQYEHGWIIPRDYSKAMECFAFAAKNGREDALALIGTIYYEQKNYTMAKRYYLQAYATEKGRGEGAYQLAVYNIQVEDDLKAAKRYLLEAIGKGLLGAKELLDAVEQDIAARQKEEEQAAAVAAARAAEEERQRAEAAKPWHRLAVAYLQVADGFKDPNMASRLRREANEPISAGTALRMANDLMKMGALDSAFVVITNANGAFPEDQKITSRAVEIVTIYIYKKWIIEQFDENYRMLCEAVLMHIDHLTKLKYPDEWGLKYNRSMVNFLRGEYEKHFGRDEVALVYFRLADVQCTPYTASEIFSLHAANHTKYRGELVKDINRMKNALLSKHWQEDRFKALTYYSLFFAYVAKDSGVKNDYNYAHTCLQKAAELDPKNQVYQEDLAKFKYSFWTGWSFKP